MLNIRLFIFAGLLVAGVFAQADDTCWDRVTPSAGTYIGSFTVQGETSACKVTIDAGGVSVIFYNDQVSNDPADIYMQDSKSTTNALAVQTGGSCSLEVTGADAYTPDAIQSLISVTLAQPAGLDSVEVDRRNVAGLVCQGLHRSN